CLPKRPLASMPDVIGLGTAASRSSAFRYESAAAMARRCALLRSAIAAFTQRRDQSRQSNGFLSEICLWQCVSTALVYLTQSRRTGGIGGQTRRGKSHLGIAFNRHFTHGVIAGSSP